MEERILVVEDDPSLFATLVEALTTEDTTPVLDGPDALEKVRAA